MNEHEALEAFFSEWHKQANESGESLTQPQRDCAEEAWHAALAWLRSQGDPAEIPGGVQSALTRMCTPLHDSRLSGATAEADARCMRVIREYIERTAAPQPAIPDGWQLVPKEPTKAMIDNAGKEHGYPGGDRSIYAKGYRSMLAATPEPTK